jgi:superfamily II DNA or RNA helicase/DNA-binding XRE family transcriptional regulator
MFPDRGSQGYKQRLERCSRCDVQVECLSAALLGGEQAGIWGGTTGAGRRSLRKVLRNAGVLGVNGEERHLVWAEPGADREPGAQPDHLEALSCTPRADQKRAVKAIVSELSGGGSAQVAMATATGKTLVALWAAAEMDVQRVLVLVPSLSLVSQTARVWARNWDRPTDWLSVASEGRGDGLDVTTEASAIRSAHENAGASGRALVVFATYQSSSVLVSAGVEWDLAIADESHHLAGDIHKPFAAIVRGEIRAARRLYLTATPRRLMRSKKDLSVRSMDDPVFGPRVFELSLGEAAEKGLVADYRVVVAAIEADVFASVAASLDEKVDPLLLAGAIAVVRAMERYRLSSCVSFHTRVDRASSFAALVGQVAEMVAPDERPSGPGFSAWVDGNTNLRLRERLLARLGDPVGWGVLANARALGEGVDIPSLDAIAIVDPKNSEVDIAQAVGRALRLPAANQAKTGLVILPVLLRSESADTDADSLAGVNKRSLDIVAGALRALRSHDGALASRMDAVRRSGGRRNADPALAAFARRLAAQTLLRSRIELDVPGGATGALAESMAIEMVREATSEWDESFGLLAEWVEAHGTALVPQGTKVATGDGDRSFWIGMWCTQQRTLHRRGILSSERSSVLEALPGWSWDPREDVFWSTFAALERWLAANEDYPTQRTVFEGKRIGAFLNAGRAAHKDGSLPAAKATALESLPGWSWDPRADIWDQRFIQLKEFVADQGHACPSVDSPDPQLGRWVRKQRAAMRTERLASDRAKQLRALRGWADTAVDAAWEEGYACLVKMVSAGSFPTRFEKSADGFGIGHWVSYQRTLFLRRKLLPARRIRLEQVPEWEWPAQRPKLDFDDWLGLLLSYADREGDALVPKKKTEGGHELGAWVSRQRTAFNKGQLTSVQVTALESVPGWVWDIADARLEEYFAALESFTEREGHARVPQRHVERSLRLGSWLNSIRDRQSTLDQSMIARLEAFPGFVWDPFGEAWELGFTELQAHVVATGAPDAQVGHVTDTGFRLGQWASVQRTTYKDGTLPANRIARLERVPGWTWDLQEQRWNEHYASLLAYAKREGHATVARAHLESGLRLGQWVRVQGRTYRRGEMRDDRRVRLEAVPGWKWPDSGNQHLDYKEEGDSLRAARQALGLTIKKLAEALGLPKTTLNDYERGRLAMPQDLLENVASLAPSAAA